MNEIKKLKNKIKITILHLDKDMVTEERLHEKQCLLLTHV